MQRLFCILVAATIASQVHSNDDRWVDDISTRFGIVTKIDATGRLEIASGEFHFQLDDWVDWEKAQDLLLGTPIFCTFHNSLAIFEDGYSVGVAPDCDVLTRDGNIPLEDFLERQQSENDI